MVKTLRKFVRLASLIFTILILTQSCTVYKEGTYSLEQAVKTDNKVKLKTIENKTIKYKKVEFANGGFYGIKNKRHMIRIPIEENHIKYVKLQDKSLSTIVTIAAPIVVIGAIIGIRSLIADSINIGY
jgi:hypothetical protein